MRGDRDFDKQLKRLRSFEPRLNEREQLIREVMQFTSERERDNVFLSVVDFMFRWADNLWLRRVLVTFSFIIIALFTSQQFTIINRIGKLEGRMVESNTERILVQQGENVILNSILLRETENSDFADSIKVADKDLIQLIESYSELQKRYQELQRKTRHQKTGDEVKI